MLSKLLASRPGITARNAVRSAGEICEHSPYPVAPDRVRSRKQVYARLETGSRKGNVSSADHFELWIRWSGIIPFLELESDHYLTIPWCSGTERVDVTESVREAALPIFCRGDEGVAHRRIGIHQPIEYVKELSTKLKRHAFPDREDPAQADLFIGVARVTVVTVVCGGDAPIAGGNVLPRGGIQREVLVRIEAVAVQIFQEERLPGTRFMRVPRNSRLPSSEVDDPGTGIGRPLA